MYPTAYIRWVKIKSAKVLQQWWSESPDQLRKPPDSEYGPKGEWREVAEVKASDVGRFS